MKKYQAVVQVEFTARDDEQAAVFAKAVADGLADALRPRDSRSGYGLPPVGPTVSEADLADQPMPWCEHCQCYHHETAQHIRKKET